MDKLKLILLVQLEINLDQKNIELYDWDYEAYLELSKMKDNLLDMIWYQNKRNLIKLFQQFLKNRISIDGFITGFQKLSQVCSFEFKITRQNLGKLIILNFNQNSKGFHKEIVSQTYILCETYLNRNNPETWQEITDVEFRKYTVHILGEIQNYN